MGDIFIIVEKIKRFIALLRKALGEFYLDGLQTLERFEELERRDDD